MSDRMRDTRQGHIKEEIEGVCVYVVGRHRWRGLSIGVCRKGVLETLGEWPKGKKNECARWIECQWRGRARRACACTRES